MATTPYQWLQELERRAKQKAKGLPRQEEVKQVWHGIAFRIGEVQLVSPLTDIHEIYDFAHVAVNLARVPGAKLWVKGLANHRGVLLPIIDLQAYLNGKSTAISNRSRMLIVNQASVYAGLIVDDVLGIKHFYEDSRDIKTPCKETWLTSYSSGLFKEDKITWVIFDIKVLAENATFLNAAL